MLPGPPGRPPGPPKKPRCPRPGAVEGVVVVVDELLAAGVAGDEVVADATAAAPAPAPRITARPAAVFVSRDRRGLRAPEPGGGGGGVNWYRSASLWSLLILSSSPCSRAW
jgi:hypothetical protein